MTILVRAFCAPGRVRALHFISASSMTLTTQHDQLLNLAFQRTLGDFETALIRLMEGLGLTGWACIFPPSFDAGGRRIMIAKGVRSTGAEQQLLQQLMQAESRPAAEALLAQLAQQMAPEPAIHRRAFMKLRPACSIPSAWPAPAPTNYKTSSAA